MLLALLERPGEDDNVHVGETEFESPQNVHEALGRLGGVVQVDEHEGKLGQAEWRGNGGLLYIVGMDRDLVAFYH
jgi:hypothetical protein